MQCWLRKSSGSYFSGDTTDYYNNPSKKNSGAINLNLSHSLSQINAQYLQGENSLLLFNDPGGSGTIVGDEPDQVGS
jgi:hypothetical protein